MFEFKFTELAKRLMMETGLDFTPYRATPLSAGYDLRYCGENATSLYPNEVKKVSTGVHIYIGDNRSHRSSNPFVGLTFPRSSSNGLVLENTIGVIDADYQGEVFLKLKNTSEEVKIVQPGDRVAQYIIFNCFTPALLEVLDFSHTTIRGNGGDGSTGRR